MQNLDLQLKAGEFAYANARHDSTNAESRNDQNTESHNDAVAES